MAEYTKIPWTDHTFNPWWGCEKVSPGCKNCYAEGQAARYGHKCWGHDTERRTMSEGHWRKPMKWDRWCKEMGLRHKVFVGSMCDVMEDRRDLDRFRERLWDLIEATPSLDWLLLTKRPENYTLLLPERWLSGCPRNVWIGTTVEEQDVAEERVDAIAPIRAVVHFLSIEPMLGPVNIGLLGTTPKDWGYGYRMVGEIINWVIVGAESGSKRRPYDPDWGRAVRDECVDAGVHFFYKQEILPNGKKVETPPLDGKVWTQSPSDEEFVSNAYM